MRAVYFPFNSEEKDSQIIISGEAAHHLNVVRLKLGDELLMLNGQGAKLITKVVAVEKKQIIAESLNIIYEKKENEFGLVIAIPKKEAFEDIMKLAVELGVTTIYPVTSKFSQYDFFQNERSRRLIESALIQSNNPWMPVIRPQSTLDIFLKEMTEPLFFFNSRPAESLSGEKRIIPKTFNLLIGPEGGFSSEETSLIIGNNKTIEVHLPTPILRAPTAVAASIGYLLALKSQSSES